MLNWLKKFSWVQTAIAVVAAIALAMLAGKARSTQKNIKKKEQLGTDLLNSGISRKLQKGKKLIESADKDKDKSVEIRQRMEARIEQLGESNEEFDAIADRFNSKRLRHSADSSHT